MKFIALFLTVVAVSTPQCKNPFAPTEPVVSGPRSGMEYCAQFTGPFGEAFYCYTPQGNVADPFMPNNWRGYCMLPDGNGLGVQGYSAITFGGRKFPVTNQTRANEFCNALVATQASDRCSSVVLCRR